MRLPRVHLITDRRLAPDLPARLAAALAGAPPGEVAVHLREKDLGGGALAALARALLPPCRARGARLLVNDRLDVALACGADGVHLPSAGVPPAEARRLLGPAALLGVSCHSAAEVTAARGGGASFATFSPIWDTPSKRSYGAPVGLAALSSAARLGLPLVALGGVAPANAAEAVAAGAAGVAVIRAWLEGPDPAAAVAALLRAAAAR
ncbi:MAG: thiamine phosphate synthase [Anaeromyxobacteraceae bacterium]|nr:thiamine phosphate synthase [Anaeromyxobacteraceae bacterium]